MSLGFLFFGFLIAFAIFVWSEWQGHVLGMRTPQAELKQPQWVVLAGVVAAIAGWIFSAWVTIRNSTKQHTMTILLQSRLSATYMENAKLFNARQP